MNIAFFVNKFPVLSQTFIVNQITGLIDLGHNVDIYAYKVEMAEVIHSDVERYGLLEKTFCHGHRGEMMPKNKACRLGRAVGHLLKNKNSALLPLCKSLSFIKYGKEATSLNLFYMAHELLAKKKKYDILHCHFGPNGNLVAKLKSLGAIDGKLITTFHGYDISKYINRKGENVYKFLFKEGDLFLPVSEVMQNQLIHLGCSPNKIRVHRMGVDPRRFSLRCPKVGGSVNILTVGRLVEKKGVNYGILGVAEMLKKFPQVKYRIVGDGPMRNSLETLIRRLGVQDKVEILGWKRQEEVRALMDDADIFLAPSVTDRNGDKEGLPVVLMEALASGLPVVSTHHSAIPELVEDGKSGFLVPEKDAEALAGRLIYLVAHPERWAEMGNAGRSKVEREFDVNKLNGELVKLYQAV